MNQVVSHFAIMDFMTYTLFVMCPIALTHFEKILALLIFDDRKAGMFNIGHTFILFTTKRTCSFLKANTERLATLSFTQFINTRSAFQVIRVSIL